MIRTFIAVKIDATPGVRKVLTRLNVAGGGIRPVAADNLHVTLKFLGDTDEALVPEVTQVLHEVVAAEPVFDVRLVGLGAFPTSKRPEVVWIGLSDAEPLSRMAAALEAELEPLGFAKERRMFHPHATLLRLRSRPPQGVFDMLEEHAATDFGAVNVGAVELYQSELQRGGSKYTVLAACALPSWGT